MMAVSANNLRITLYLTLIAFYLLKRIWQTSIEFLYSRLVDYTHPWFLLYSRLVDYTHPWFLLYSRLVDYTHPWFLLYSRLVDNTNPWFLLSTI
jgi:hypothetical protein